jgi:hypothetical protein
VTGGGLAGAAPLTGIQSLAYHAEDTDSGVRLSRLLIDAQPAAEIDYASQCPYTNFQACPPSKSDTIGWNTASVADGQHRLELTVENAAQNTSVVYDGTITTENAPSNTSSPVITASSQPLGGATLSASTGGWSTPAGAGSVSYGYQWRDCDPEGISCQDISGAQSSSYAPSASDGGRTLRVTVTAADSDGLTAAASPATGVVLTGAPAGGVDGFTSSSWGTGAANGLGASESARLEANGDRVIKRTFQRRAFTLSGRLAEQHGQPIAGAVLDVMAQAATGGQMRLISQARTLSDGTFLAHVAGGASRQVLLGYRAYSGDPGYTTQVQVGETVSAGVQLNITPHHAGPGGLIVLFGRVQGPVPPQGTIVELLVHYRGRWEPFRTPRTDSRGRFRVTYQFEGSIGRFPFRALVPAGQASFPYTSGYSNIVDVRTG